MSLFLEVMAYNSILEKWKKNPALTKHQIGIWSHWIEGGEGTDAPLSEQEVNQMKEFLRRMNPSGYNRLFPE